MNGMSIQWNGGLQREAVDVLCGDSGMIAAPAKVGYVLMTTDRAGLERKFEAKSRPRGKPGVVMCASFDQLVGLASVNDEVGAFIEHHWQEDILLGCILPWSKAGRRHIPEGAEELVTDYRRTSCFVVRCGTPADLITHELWENHNKVTFASSANPSGHGNRGTVEGIGQRIRDRVDLLVAADAYVWSVQPSAGTHDRYSQGVMVSMVDTRGALVPQEAAGPDDPRPTVIRTGLDIDRIMVSLGTFFPAWDYRHGTYC